MFLTMEIKPEDWVNKDANHLNADCSYLDIKKIESLDKDVLLQKCRDHQNRFQCVAKLCDKKYQDLRDLRNKVLRSPRPVPTQKANLILTALNAIKIPDNKLQELKLE